MSVTKEANLTGHKDAVLTLAADLHERRLFSGSQDGMLRVWDLATGKSVRLLDAFERAPVTAITQRRDEPHSLYCAAGSKVFAFDLRRPEIIVKVPQALLVECEDEVDALCLDHDGKRLAVADDTGLIQVVDLQTKACLRKLNSHQNIVSSLSFRPSKPNELLSGGLDSLMFLSDLTNGRTLHKWDLGAEQRLLAQRGLSAQPNFNPPLVHQLRIVSSRYALAALGSGEVASYDLQTGKSVFRLPAHFNAATSLSVARFHPSSSFVVSGGADRHVVLSYFKWPQAFTPGADLLYPLPADSSAALAVPGGSQIVLKINHGLKVNAIETLPLGVGVANCFVGDTSGEISAYTFR